MAIALLVALFLLRVVVGLTLLVHGTQKLFGWFGGPGLARFHQGFARQGFKPSWLWVALVMLGEVGGGLSLALGFLTPLGAAGVFGAMLMATVKVHWKNGFIASKGGIEYTLVLLTVAVSLGLAGPGLWSIDTQLGFALPEAPVFLVLAGVAVVVDAIGLLLTSRASTSMTPSTPATSASSAPPADAR